MTGSTGAQLSWPSAAESMPSHITGASAGSATRLAGTEVSEPGYEIDPSQLSQRFYDESDTAFVLQNTWDLEEVDLDKQLQDVTAAKPAVTTTNNNSATRLQ